MACQTGKVNHNKTTGKIKLKVPLLDVWACYQPELIFFSDLPRFFAF